MADDALSVALDTLREIAQVAGFSPIGSPLRLAGDKAVKALLVLAPGRCPLCPSATIIPETIDGSTAVQCLSVMRHAWMVS